MVRSVGRLPSPAIGSQPRQWRRTVSGSTQTEAAHRPRGQPPGLELVVGQQVGRRLVDDDPVAAGHRGQPRGEVDRWAEHVAEPHHDVAAGQSDPHLGHPRVAADDADDPLGDVVGRHRVGAHEQHRVAEALDDPAPLPGDDVGAARLEDLDDVADPVAGQLVGERREADDVGEADADLGGVQVLRVGAQRLDPGQCRRQVAPPGVDHQPLEGGVELLEQVQALVGARPGGRVGALQLLDPVGQGRDLPVGQPGHRLAEGAGQHHADVDVDRTAGDHRVEGRDGRDVVGGEGDRGAVLGEAERPPEPTQLVDGHAGLLGDLERGERRVLPEDRPLEGVRVATGPGPGLRGWFVRSHRRCRGGRRAGAARRRPSAAPLRRAGCRGSRPAPARWRRRRPACRSRRAGRPGRSRSRRR